MKLTRYLRPAQIKLQLVTRNPLEIPQRWTRERYVWAMKEQVLRELVDLFEVSGKVGNTSKLFTDLCNRERKASTAVGDGVAIPHVRTMQAKDFVFSFARSIEGVEFGAIDGRSVHFFFGVIAPPYDDKLYLKVYKKAGLIFKSETARQLLMSATDEHQVIKVLSDFDSWGEG